MNAKELIKYVPGTSSAKTERDRERNEIRQALKLGVNIYISPNGWISINKKIFNGWNKNQIDQLAAEI